MAEIEETVPLDVSDAELFTEAIEPKEQLRDEKGRYAAEEKPEAAKAEPDPAPQAEAAPTQQQTPEKDEANVPSWRLREERESREREAQRAANLERQLYAAQAQAQSLQQQFDQFRLPKQEPVDFWSNPEAAVQQQIQPALSPLEKSIMSAVRNSSEGKAIARYGADKYDAASKAAQTAMAAGDPSVAQLANYIRESDDPAEVLMQWHMQRDRDQRIGNDPDAWLKAEMEKHLADPQNRAKYLEQWRGDAQPQPGQRPAISLPPSLNKAPGAGNTPITSDADMSDAALFRHAITSGR